MHKHDKLIREWLDNGMPQVECSCNSGDTWSIIRSPSWQEEYTYRLVYPEESKRTVNMLCWYDSATMRLVWVNEIAYISGDWVRVPSEDKVIEI